MTTNRPSRTALLSPRFVACLWIRFEGSGFSYWAQNLSPPPLSFYLPMDSPEKTIFGGGREGSKGGGQFKFDEGRPIVLKNARHFPRDRKVSWLASIVCLLVFIFIISLMSFVLFRSISE